MFKLLLVLLVCLVAVQSQSENTRLCYGLCTLPSVNGGKQFIPGSAPTCQPKANATCPTDYLTICAKYANGDFSSIKVSSEDTNYDTAELCTTIGLTKAKTYTVLPLPTATTTATSVPTNTKTSGGIKLFMTAMVLIAFLV